MGLIAKLLGFEKVDDGQKYTRLTVDSGGGYNKTVLKYSAPGDDSLPLAGDSVATTSNQATGGVSAVGYIDPVNEPKGELGDKRIYARDPDTGLSVCEIWLKSDSSILISNAAGSIELQAGGNVVINGVTIDISGNITTSAKVSANEVEAMTSLKVATKEVNGHTHTSTTPGNQTGQF